MHNALKIKNRLRLSPLEKEILWTLHEAGEENLTVLLNIVEPLVFWSSEENFLPYCEQALANLCKLKYIEFRIEQESRVQLPLSGEFDLHLAMQRDSDGLWQQAESWNGEGRIVVVQLVDHWT